MFVAVFKHLCTTIPHKLLQSRIKELMSFAFQKKNWEQGYQYLVFGRDFDKKLFKI